MPRTFAYYAFIFLLTTVSSLFCLVAFNSHPIIISPLATQAQAQSLHPTATPSPTPIPPTATPTPIPPTPQPIVTSSDIETLFSKYSSQYGADENELKKIANCESSFNSNADNGINAGMFQYGQLSWINVRTAMGADTNPELRKNAEESIKTAAFHISHYGTSAWLNCR